MQVVISRWGSHGDVLPYLAVGSVLSARGHDVTFVGNPQFEARAREAGLGFVAVGRQQDHDRLMADPDVWSRSRKSTDQVYQDHYYPHMASHFEAVMEHVTRPRAVVIAGELGGITAAERAGVPLVYMSVSPASSRFAVSRYDPPHPERVLPRWAARVARTGAGLRLLYALNAARHGRRSHGTLAGQVPPDHPLGRLRTAHGLPLTTSFGARLVLFLWPDWFAAPQRDWPATARTTGFPLYSPPAVRSGSDAPAGPAPIVVTTGSAAGSQFRFYETAVEACRLLDRPAVLVSPHRDHIPAQLPSNITHVTFAPLGELLSRASIVIHHGGIGTASFALAAGIPQIALPLRGDQFDNGNRLQRLGVGAMLNASQTSPRALARTITSLLGSPRVVRRCRYWQTRTAASAGLINAADAIESVA